MIDLLLSATTITIFLTAIAFTVTGWFMATTTNTQKVVAATIDKLIDDGYLKTTGTGKDLEIIRWQEWDNE